MNYRHAYHAGNFADVFKHIVLTRVVEYLKRKEGAFRVYDTHAGRGIYDLSSGEAGKTGEWIGGIGRVINADFSEKVEALLAPYRSILKDNFENNVLEHYPGSPVVIRKLLRHRDRLCACELHEDDHAVLAVQFDGDYQSRILLFQMYLGVRYYTHQKELLN